MIMYTRRLATVPVLALLLILGSLCRCTVALPVAGGTAGSTAESSSLLDVFVEEESLEEILSDEPSLRNDTAVYIICNGTSSVLGNGSLQIDNTGIPLPPLPPSVDYIAFTWIAKDDTEVQYDIGVSEISDGILETLELSIPLTGYINDTSEFMISLTCTTTTNALASILVQFNFSLFTGDITTEFILQKDCKDTSPSPSPSTTLSVLQYSSPVDGSTTPSPVEVKLSSSMDVLFPSLEAVPSSSVIMSSSLGVIPSSSVITSSSVEAVPSSSLIISSSEVIPSSSVIISSLEVIPSSSAIISSSLGVIPSSSVIMSSSVEAVPSSSVIISSSEVIPSSSVIISSSEVIPSSSVIISSSEVIPSSSVIISSSEVIPSSSVIISSSEVIPSSSVSVSSEITLSSSEVISSSAGVVPSSTEVRLSSLSLEQSLSLSTTPMTETLSSSLYSSSFLLLSSSMEPTPSPTSGVPWMLYGVAFGPVAGFLVLCIFIITCCLCCIKCAKKKTTQQGGFADYPYEECDETFEDDEDADKYKKLEAPMSIWTHLSWGHLISLPQHTQTLVKTINIDRRKIAITNTFVRGTNGCLNRGILMMDRINPSSDANVGTIMKIMTGLGDRGHRDDITRFIEQTTLMQGLEHPNILALLGLSIEDNCVPVAIYPLTEYGNLHFALEVCRLMPDDNPFAPFTTDSKTNLSYQLASAMKFLSDKKVVHHDLALRNCWLDTGLCLKLSDGALSQDIYPDCYTNIKGAIRPVKWSAIETLQEGLLTTQSNVWSYGVVVWEIFTVAKEPYGDIPNRSIVSHLMMDGRLPYPSEDCPEQLFSLLLTCWNQRGEERPRFTAIYDILKSLNRYNSPPPHQSTTAQQQQLYDQTDPYHDFSATTFGKDVRQAVTVLLEPAATNAISATGGEGPSSFKRPMSHKRSSDHHLSSTSIGRAEKISLTFSILDDSDGSGGSGSESEDGSFPSTLKSRVSVNTATNQLVSQTENGGITTESLATLKPSSPAAPPTIPPSVSPDIATSTAAESSASNRSSLIPAAACGSTDRSSFYSTGIDSISTTHSTPLPHLLGGGHAPGVNGMELRTFSEADRRLPSPQAMTTPLSTTPFKSTDSGIRSDEESNSSTGSHTGGATGVGNAIEDHTPEAPPKVELRIPQTERIRDSSRTASGGSRTSLGFGNMDFSSELMAALDSFSTFKPSL